MGWMKGLFRRGRAERVLDDEVQQHIDMLAAENEQRGMPREQARREAMLRFGAVSSVKEQCREQNGVARVESVWQDLRFAWRTFLSRPGFTVVLLLTLALGIGANTAVYSVLRAVLLKPLPLTEPERIVRLWEQDRVNHTEREGASYPDFEDLLRDTTHFEHLAASAQLTATMTGQDEPERIQGARVSSNYFAAIGARPILGRVFNPREPGILLSHGLWQRKFGGVPDVIGRVLRLDGFPGTVLGVMPPEANSPNRQPVDLWTALEAVPNRSLRGQHNFGVWGRLREGSSVQEAQAEVTAIMARLEKEYPNDNAGRGAAVVPLHEDLAGNMRPALRLLTGAVAVLLFVACLNIANLLLAGGSTRTREMAIRVSLGAARSRLARQLLTESLLLALAGAGLGVLVASAGVRCLVALAPAEMPLIGRAAIDWNSMAVALGISLAAWAVFGVLPALRASALAPAGALKESSHTTVSKGALRLRNGLVIVQLAMTCVLVIAAGLLIRSFWRLQHVDLGYQPAGAVTLRLQLPETRYSTPQFPEFTWPQGLAFFDRLKTAAGSLPGVEAASIVLAGPNRSNWTTRVSVAGRPTPPQEALEEAQVRTGDPAYLKASGARLIQGRFFEAADVETREKVAVINEAFVRRYFPGENPVGQRIAALFGPYRIVGVIGDIRYDGPAAVPSPTMYFSAYQFALPEQTLIVRTKSDPASLVPVLRKTVRDLDPSIAPFDVQPIETALLTVTARERFILSLLTGFAVLSLTLAVVGVYGVVAFAVGRRRQEIALRMVLGARASQVFGQIIGGVLRRVAAGVAMGLALALPLGRVIQPLVFETSTRDIVTYAVVIVMLLAAALFGAAIPAHRASRVNAAAALRQE